MPMPYFREQYHTSAIAVHLDMVRAACEPLSLLKTKANGHVRQVGFGFADRGIDRETQRRLY